MSYLGRSAKLSLKAQEKVSFLATAGQTEKTGLSYTPTFVEVYVNGVLLTDTTDFTATNGNSITFTVALLLNDEVTVISLKTFTVADHYTKSDADTLLAATTTTANAALPKAGGSLTGAVDFNNNNAYFKGNATHGYRFNSASDAANLLTIYDSGDTKIWAGDLVFGTAGKGIVLGATTNVDANTLDDYEEGTWTPNFAAAGGGSLTTTSNSAYYTKVGNLVTAWFDQLAWSSHNLTGTYLNITGLPFPLASSRSVASPGVSSSNSFNSLDRLMVQGDSGSSTLWMISMGATNNNYAHMAAASVAATGTWYGMTITYRTA